MKTIIHVDQATIRRNRKDGTNDPPLIIRTYLGAKRAQEIVIDGPCTIRHSPNNPLSCGARVWIETCARVHDTE